MASLSSLDIALSVLAAFLVWKIFNRKGGLPLPPGPKGYPILGNALEFPTTYPWVTFAKWGETWGGIMSVTVLGQPIVVVNDPIIAMDLLNKTGSAFADRPPLPMATLCGWDRALSSARYGPRFLRYRKMIGRVIGTKGSMTKFQPTKDFQATMFLKRLLDNPDKLDEATRKTAGAVILDLTYGYIIKEEGKDPLVDLADKALGQFSEVTATGAFLIDMIPWLKYVPAWVPGAGFKKTAASYKATCDQLGAKPLGWLKEQMANGEARPSYAHDLLAEPNLSAQDMDDIEWSAASFYGAGADTTVSVVYAYFLALAIYPEVEAKAHAEMDRVVGSNRLPSYEDRENLPYVDAICKELLRWLPIVPLAVPHRAIRNETFGEYGIPEGTLVIANVWKFLHDPAVYKDPMRFNPDRFMGPNPEQDPKDFCFGFGRRVCPGIHLADSSIWINIAKSVAAFNVKRAIGPDGKEIIPVPETNDGIITRPKLFKCNVQARTPHVMEMVEKDLAAAA